jgi:very-short-patch-repair endonuclease
MRRILPYNPKLKQLARNLRNNGTLGEVLLWEHLKNRRMEGHDFHRQKPIGNYILDFFCQELMLAIEIDGCTHDQKCESDKRRQAELERLGIRFLRFQEKEVRGNIEGIVEMIRMECNTPRHPSGATPLERG